MRYRMVNRTMRLLGRITPKAIALVTYVAYLLAGLSFVLFPAPSVEENTGQILIFVFHTFLILGSSISFIGNIRRNAWMELAGIPLLASAFFAYVSILLGSWLTDGDPSQSGSRIGVGLLLFGGFLSIVGRAMEIMKVIVVDSRLQDREEG